MVGWFLGLCLIYATAPTDQLTETPHSPHHNPPQTAIENRNSVLHGATVVAHGYMNAGTTTDTFLRENLEWLGRASHWAKFTATASLGVVHKGHVKESMNLLQPYLPQGGISASPYSEAGALYALGLIHASKGGAGNQEVITYLHQALKYVLACSILCASQPTNQPNNRHHMFTHPTQTHPIPN